MSPSESAAAPAPPDTDLVEWRRGRLVHAGADPELASVLAREPGFDLHAVLALIDKGCDPRLAARILAPLDSSFDW
jgi:hypothetical protein